MGIDFDGGMIVGESGRKISLPEDFDCMSEWADSNDMTKMAMHYDADDDCCLYGFNVDDILVSEIDEGWLADIRAKAAKFEELTGVPAKLIGTQNIW